MQWERLSLLKEISQVTAVTGRDLPILKKIKKISSSQELYEFIKNLRKKAHTGGPKLQCVMGFLCCIGFSERKGKKKLYGSAIGRLTQPKRTDGTLLYAVGDDYYAVAGAYQDLEEAAYWYRRSAAGGYHRAQTLYGDHLFSGEGVEPDIDQAVRFYMQAAKADDAEAYRRLGDCAYLGIGLIQDSEKAVKYFEKAARLGCRDSLWRLGDMYYQGEGVEKSVVIAESFYEEAAEKGVAAAMGMLGDICFHEVETEYGAQMHLGIHADTIRHTKDAQMIEGYVNACKYYKKAAKLEDEWGLFSLGMCYYFGKGVRQSYKKAVKYFVRAANFGCPDALWKLASCYYNGIGIKKNKKKAYRCYRQAVEMLYMQE